MGKPYQKLSACGRYVFREILPHELEEMFALILSRMRWMDEVGIKQWNVTYYDEVYPLSYYEECRKKGEIYVLSDIESGDILCVAALKSEDERWENDGVPAYYLHHFASRTDRKGIGSIYLQLAEQFATEQGKVYFRLDSAVCNMPLERYYSSRGYKAAGKCVDGLYEGILRQKKL